MSAGLKTYYYLAKPGIVYGNALTATAGFLLAAKGNIDLVSFVAMLVGLSLIMASACVVNNYLDRGIDAKMDRTKRRALVSGAVTVWQAAVYAAVLGLAGAALLAIGTNWLALVIGIFGYFAYVVIYGIAKRRTVHGTVIGSISGAVPPVVGYVAASGRLDGGAWLVFLILVCWQMPHFYAIAVYRLADYKAAGIPVLPAVRGLNQTKLQINLYIIGFIVASILLTVFGYASWVYLLLVIPCGLAWLVLALKGFKVTDATRWGRQLFLFSLVVISVLSVALSIGGWLA